jgi:hypothetical protein
MIKWLFLFLFPLSLNALEDNGVVSIYFPGGNEHEVKLYHSPADPKPFAICYSDDQLDSLMPSFYRYGGRVFITYRCAGDSGGFYCIRKNELPSPYYWIKKDSLTEFFSWDKWMAGFGEVYIPSKCIFYSGPDEHSNVVTNFCNCGVCGIGEIKGDWVKIYFDETYAEYIECSCAAIKRSDSAWIKWREGDAILVDVYIAE